MGGLVSTASTSGLAIRLADRTTRKEVDKPLQVGIERAHAALPDDVGDMYKFADTLPDPAAIAMLDARARDIRAVQDVVARPFRSHRLNTRAPRP